MTRQSTLSVRVDALENKIWTLANSGKCTDEQQMEAEQNIGYLRAMRDFMRWGEHSDIIVSRMEKQCESIEETFG